MTGAGLIRGDSVALPFADDSVDLIVTSPPYFALRSYTDGGEHYDGQIGSEQTPRAFLDALWAVTRECARVLKPSGSMFVNLGDKYAGSGGHNNSNLPGNTSRAEASPTGSTRRNAPDRYNQAADVRAKSLMGLPWLYALGCTGALDALGGPDTGLDLILRAEVVWSKPNGLPESVTDRVRRSHEQWFHLTKSPRYYSAVDEVREPHTTSDALTRVRSSNYRSDAREVSPSGTSGNPLGKLPGSVWTIPSEPLSVPTFVDGQPWGSRPVWGDPEQLRRLWGYAEHRHSIGQPAVVWECDHFAAFPQEWPRRLILGWSPPGICVECDEGRRPVVEREFHGEHNTTEAKRQRERVKTMSGGVDKVTLGRTDDIERRLTGYACACPTPDAPTRPAVVLDPFGGTGTTAMVARALGRYGVHVDLSADYLRLARWRIFESGHASKTDERTNREAQGTLL